MENKRYLDKVLDHLVRNIKIDYEKELVFTPPLLSSLSLSYPLYLSLSPLLTLSPPSFRLYCKDQFGLTKEEMVYVWEEYKKILIDKIKQQ